MTSQTPATGDNQTHITLRDALNNPISSLEYEVRKAGQIILQGATNAKGDLRVIRAKIGDEIEIHVKKLECTEMKLVKKIQLTAEKVKIILNSPKILYHVTPQLHDGEKGDHTPQGYTVKAGDTLAKIAKDKGVTVHELARANHIQDVNQIAVGQLLIIPAHHTATHHEGGGHAHHHAHHHLHHHRRPHPVPTTTNHRSAETGHPVAVVPPMPNQNGENDFTEQDAKEALQYIYTKYGRVTAEIIEKMYRTETRHFQSMQYRRCGTGGMEVHGEAPYYGWNSAFFTEAPTGTWSAFEGAGLSGAGGNQQVTTHRKVFVVVSSVKIGMEFKAKYIAGHGGNYARWYSTDPHAQALYRQTLDGITPRIVNSFQ